MKLVAKLKNEGKEAHVDLEAPALEGADSGIPPENVANADFIEVGELAPGAQFVTRRAPPVGGNPGGGIEAVVSNNGVSLLGFSIFKWDG